MDVKLIEYTNCPDKVCGKAARVCVSETPDLDNMFSDTDFERSLDFAMKSGHTSVAEHAVFTFHVTGISRACSHQLVRHRLASYSQQSQRYVRMHGCFKYVTPPEIAENELMKRDYDAIMERIQKCYDELVEVGYIQPEDARYVLPNAACTNIVVTMNGRELLNFFTLRTCNKAQWEIRELAMKMLKLVKPLAPILFEDAGPNCMHDCGCQELRPCDMDVPMGPHTMRRESHETE